MAKTRTSYVCNQCRTSYNKWAGRCDNCGEWNSLEEQSEGSGIGATPIKGASKGRRIELVPLHGDIVEAPRYKTGISEFDRVAGGGIVPGSALLVGGDPGIGKSTLLLQVAAKLADSGKRVVYISGEEAIAQVRMRAERLKIQNSAVELGAETNLSNIIATLDDPTKPKPALVIIDSIQTMWSDNLDSPPGTVSQVRTSSQTLIRYAKAHNVAVILVGHVTKDGQIAGPRVIEHMVDAVLYFEGERGHQYRILRGVKNRFGATDEIGVFEMTGLGLAEVTNPSELFLGDRDGQTPGAAVFAGMEGTRPLLVEIQALVAETSLATPRRAVVGWDSSRLAMILAVLDAHCGLGLSKHDVYLNVAGGLKIKEPAADMAVAAALISSISQKPLPKGTIIFGEIALSGATRNPSQSAARLKEAEKLGFSQAIIANLHQKKPKNEQKGAKNGQKTAENEQKMGLKVAEVNHLMDLVAKLAANMT
ncbi:MAG: DNA repair protein RadA [Rhizobiales bacterium]|nr:DNA repair protein RadA [Hyphomicrobiales bacterium]NRB13008.1 DNA repair protein RadA [Hyphomicrobiales bacterium]